MIIGNRTNNGFISSMPTIQKGVLKGSSSRALRHFGNGVYFTANSFISVIVSTDCIMSRIVSWNDLDELLSGVCCPDHAVKT